MKRSSISKTFAAALIAGSVLAIAGCGGWDNANPPPPAPTTFTVAGTAATGAPFAGATVTVTDSTGAQFTGPTGGVITGTDGSYTITLPLTAKPPFVLQAVRSDQTLVSVVALATNTTTNITPVTNLIASRLSVSGDPAKLAAEIQANPALVDATKLTAKVAEVVALIKPLMDAIGDSTDPLNGKIVANGTGADKVLDSLSISITPSSATSVNIAVSVKQQLADNVQPAVIAFTNTTAPAAALPAVTAANLVPSGASALIADFLTRMTACYALAQTVRVNSSGTIATDIIAPACKDLFLGNDPTSYKNNGAIVSSTGAFSSLFGSATGVTTFDHGSYAFTRANGDLVIAYRATDSSGNSTNNTLVVRTDTDGKLRAIGNQNKYNGGVNAYHQLRTFVNQAAATYYSTGYNLNVNNVLDASGKTIFSKVVVTAPDGTAFTLKPATGYTYLPLMNGTTVTETNFVRIESVYTAAANSGKNPANTNDSSLYFAATPLTDAAIALLAAQSTWRFDYYLLNNPTVIDATQYYKTLARAMTIAELQTQPLATLTAADITNITTNTKTNASGGLYLPTPATGPVTLDWVVPTGALAPTSIQVWGGATVSGASISYNDIAPVASTARTGTIACSLASAADKHCSGGNYVSGGFGGEHLWASDAAGRQFASFYAFYAVTIK